MNHTSLPAWHPRWADCPVYESACAWSTQAHTDLEPQPNLAALQQQLAQARVIKVDQSQLDAVFSAMPDWAVRDATASDVAMPFGSTFIELDAASDNKMRGVLVVQDELNVDVLPFVTRHEERRNIVRCVGHCGWAGKQWLGIPWVPRGLANVGNRRKLRGVYSQMFTDAGGWALALDYLLRSANVTTAEKACSRQVRRAAKRDGLRIPLQVVVRSSSGSATTQHGSVEYSHRFEVRAHFQHHSKGPIFEKCKDPAKRVMHNGVECVRVWNPGSVKGPADKPFVPKVRDATKLAGLA